MWRVLPGPVLGVITTAILVSYTAVASVVVYLVAFARLVVPWRPWRRGCDRLLEHTARTWVRTTHHLIRGTQPTEWDVRGATDLGTDATYLVVANHQSWLDIPVLFEVFGDRIPFPRFFVKHQLLWAPLIGFAMWALGFPFMKRYSREVLARKPHLRGRVLEATRRACERFVDQPAAIINFLEGTRFTPAKHAHQESPYRHLLIPRAGGLAYALDVMGEQFHELLDVTIVYPQGTPSIWDGVCGCVRRIVVRVRRRRIPAQLIGGDYTDDPAYRRRMQLWVAELWRDKDVEIDTLRREQGLEHAA